MENHERKQPIPEVLKDEHLDAVTGGLTNADHTITIEPGKLETLTIEPSGNPRDPFVIEPGVITMPDVQRSVSFDRPLLDHSINNSGVGIETIQSQVLQRSREP